MNKRKITSLERKRKKNTRTQINIYWHRNRKNFSLKYLIFFLEKTSSLFLARKILVEFLNRKNLNFDYFYQIANPAKRVINKYKTIEKDFWTKCFNICTMYNLAELAEIGESAAVKEALRRIDKGIPTKMKSLQVLIRLFHVVKSSKGITILWNRIKKLDPEEKDLKYIIELTAASCQENLHLTERTNDFEKANKKIMSEAQKTLAKKSNERKKMIKMMTKLEGIVS